MANIMAMTVARDVHLAGLSGPLSPARRRPRGRARLRLATRRTSPSAGRSTSSGFPRDTLRVIAVGRSVPAPRREPVAEAIAADRAAGLTPIAIAAVAGSTNTGSVDLTPELAELARREGLWLHVDAAYGGAARLQQPRRRARAGPRAGRFRHDRPAQVVLPGLRSRAPDRARRDDPLTDVPPGTRVLPVEPAPGRAAAGTGTTIEGTRRFRGPSSCGCRGSTWAPRVSAVSIDQTTTCRPTSATRCAGAWTSRRPATEPDLSVVCFRSPADGWAWCPNGGHRYHQLPMQRARRWRLVWVQRHDAA